MRDLVVDHKSAQACPPHERDNLVLSPKAYAMIAHISVRSGVSCAEGVASQQTPNEPQAASHLQ